MTGGRVAESGRGKNADQRGGKQKGFHHRTNSLQIAENALAALTTCNHAATMPASEW
jgi:hypothetical protein